MFYSVLLPELRHKVFRSLTHILVLNRLTDVQVLNDYLSYRVEKLQAEYGSENQRLGEVYSRINRSVVERPLKFNDAHIKLPRLRNVQITPNDEWAVEGGCFLQGSSIV